MLETTCLIASTIVLDLLWSIVAVRVVIVLTAVVFIVHLAGTLLSTLPSAVLVICVHACSDRSISITVFLQRGQDEISIYAQREIYLPLVSTSLSTSPPTSPIRASLANA